MTTNPLVPVPVAAAPETVPRRRARTSNEEIASWLLMGTGVLLVLRAHLVAPLIGGLILYLILDRLALWFSRHMPHAAARPLALILVTLVGGGFIVGEGAGIVILESLEHATQRNAPILAEIVGYGRSGDTYHITQPVENGDGAFRVMRAALKDAKLSPNDISYVNAHGTSTPIGDVIETTAMKRLFGERAINKQLPVSSTKSMTGHLLGGAGGLEAGISVLALRDQILPPTINQFHADPKCDLDYVPNVARKATVDYVLSNSFGFGGTNAALIFKRWAGK